MKIFSIPLNPKLTPEEFDRFYKLVDKYKDYIYDIYFTSRIPPFITDAMGDVFDPQQSVDIMENSFIFQDVLGIPLSATFNNIEIPPTMEFLDMWIANFKPLYDRGIRTVTLPHTIWMLSGKIQKAYPDLFVKNTILRNVQRANEVVKLVEAGFSYINLDRDLMRDHDTLREIKKAKEYCIEKYGRDIKISLLANEACWGNCSVQDEHFQFNNTRVNVKAPTYFMTQLSKLTCPAWDRDDPGNALKKADFPPWREDWLEFVNELGIDVIKMHGREYAPKLFETMSIIENFANGKETLINQYDSYVEDMKISGSPINIWREKIKTCKFDCWDCNYCNKVVAAKSGHRYIDQIKLALNNADAGKSKLTQEILDIPGFTSSKIKHFINNLTDMVDTRYLEIGAEHGPVFSAAVQGNQIAAIAIDDYLKDVVKPEMSVESWISTPSPIKGMLNKNIYLAGFKGSRIVDKPFLDVSQDDLTFKASILFYNGDHSLEAHVNAIKHYYDLCDEVFILVVDDWNWAQVQEGTRQGIKETGLKIKYENAILTQGEDPEDYWNGLGIFVLAKN